MLSTAKREYIEARTRLETLFYAVTQTEGFPDHPGDHLVIANRLGGDIDDAIERLEVCALNLADQLCGGKSVAETLAKYGYDHPVREQSDTDDGPEDELLDGQAWPNDPPDCDSDDDGDAYTMDEAYPDRPH